MQQENAQVFAYDDYLDSTPPPFDGERWKAIRDRLIDELAKGEKTLDDFASDGMEPGRLKIWLKSPDSFPRFGRRVGEKTAAEQIADALEARFAEIDHAGIDYRLRCPVRVETTLTHALIEAAETARNLCELVDFSAAPGLGKTEARSEYIARMRKAEGFFCPVWSIELDDSCITLKAVLDLIARQIPEVVIPNEKGDFAIAQAIIEATKGRRGLLFIDEGQHLADAQKKMGIPIVNMLRRLVDRGCFGIVYVGNGEIYRRLSAGTIKDKNAYTQIFSRMEDFRVEVGPYKADKRSFDKSLTKADVLAVAKSWGVIGVEEESYCLRAAEKPGALRAMTNILRVSMERYGSLDIKCLTKVRAL